MGFFLFDFVTEYFNILAGLSFLLISGVALLYIFWDVNYFLRIGFVIGYSKLFLPEKKPTDESVLYGYCTTQDVDIFLRHMNNARYIRELDFARFQYYERSGLYRGIVERGGTALQGASNIRYRRTIPIFTAYKIITKLVYWDEKAMYLEQQFITLNDNFVRAIALSKQNIVGVNVCDLLKTLLADEYKDPEKPAELDHWLESIEISSAKLREKKND